GGQAELAVSGDRGCKRPGNPARLAPGRDPSGRDQREQILAVALAPQEDGPGERRLRRGKRRVCRAELERLDRTETDPASHHAKDYFTVPRARCPRGSR